MRFPLSLTLGVALAATSFGYSQTSDYGSGVLAFRDGAYANAISLLEAECKANPRNALAAADLLSALVNKARYEEAIELADNLQVEFPKSADVLAARGDLAYYLGDMSEANRLYLEALKSREETARAYLGLFRLYRSASLYHAARRSLMRANAIDGGDAEIQSQFFGILTPEKEKEEVEKFLKTHPCADFNEDLRSDTFDGIELEKALKGRDANQPVGEQKTAVVRLCI